MARDLAELDPGVVMIDDTDLAGARSTFPRRPGAVPHCGLLLPLSDQPVPSRAEVSLS
ncbi:MAG: hypothetical protein GY708_09165 [Actinomycetia bacterium]|nr:hypothetical protein [Actinomycetes bacterium]